MKNNSIWPFVFCFFLPWLSSNRALAQNASQSFIVRPWAVGQFATFQTKIFSDQNLIGAETTTYSVVGLEVVDTKNYFWVEIEQAKGDGVTIVQKMQLRPPALNDFENNIETDFHFWAARRRIQKISLPGPVHRSSVNEFEVPPEIAGQAAEDIHGGKTKDISKQFDVTPDQTVQTEAGTFKARKFHLLDAGSSPASAGKTKDLSRFLDAWGTPEVPILGLVKKSTSLIGSDQTVYRQETELISYGDSGAYSKIKGNVPVISLAQQKKILHYDSAANNGLQSGQGKP
jgi:hypothetical protein